MATREGAMIGGYLLPEKEFKEVIKELFLESDNVKILKDQVRLALQNIKSKNIRAAYKNMENIQIELFQNPTTSLMLISNLYDENGNYQFSWNRTEKDVIRKSGKLSYAKTVKNSLLEEELNQTLSRHLNNMIKMIETTDLTNEEIDRLFKYYKFGKRRSKSEVGRDTHYDRNLRWIVYGDNPNYRGNIADAFLNHVGNMHKELLIGDYSTASPIVQSVAEEEGENFYQLLLDSTNNTPWFTGGDLILLNKNSEVIANIQLKTILREKGGTVGQIKTNQLEEDLRALQELINTESILDAEQFADKMFNLYKTSGVYKEMEDKVDEIAINEVKNKLNLTNQKICVII